VPLGVSYEACLAKLYRLCADSSTTHLAASLRPTGGSAGWSDEGSVFRTATGSYELSDGLAQQLATSMAESAPMARPSLAQAAEALAEAGGSFEMAMALLLKAESEDEDEGKGSKGAAAAVSGAREPMAEVLLSDGTETAGGGSASVAVSAPFASSGDESAVRASCADALTTMLSRALLLDLLSCAPRGSEELAALRAQVPLLQLLAMLRFCFAPGLQGAGEGGGLRPPFASGPWAGRSFGATVDAAMNNWLSVAPLSESESALLLDTTVSLLCRAAKAPAAAAGAGAGAMALFTVGQVLQNVISKTGSNRECTVLAVSGTGPRAGDAVLLHYNGYEDQFDEWLDLTDEDQLRRLNQPLTAAAGAAAIAGGGVYKCVAAHGVAMRARPPPPQHSGSARPPPPQHRPWPRNSDNSNDILRGREMVFEGIVEGEMGRQGHRVLYLQLPDERGYYPIDVQDGSGELFQLITAADGALHPAAPLCSRQVEMGEYQPFSYEPVEGEYENGESGYSCRVYGARFEGDTLHVHVSAMGDGSMGDLQGAEQSKLWEADSVTNPSLTQCTLVSAVQSRGPMGMESAFAQPGTHRFRRDGSHHLALTDGDDWEGELSYRVGEIGMMLREFRFQFGTSGYSTVKVRPGMLRAVEQEEREEPERAAALQTEAEERAGEDAFPSDAELLAGGATLVRSRELLLAACAAGGVVVLADDAVIELTEELEITVDVTISGGGAIRGNQLVVVEGATLILRGITCAGLFAEGQGTRLQTYDVRVLNSEGSGIDAESGAKASIEGGSIQGSGDDGVRVYTGSTMSLRRVVISNSERHGIDATDDGKAIVREGCTVSDSGGQDYYESTGGTIERVAAAPADEDTLKQSQRQEKKEKRQARGQARTEDEALEAPQLQFAIWLLGRVRAGGVADVAGSRRILDCVLSVSPRLGGGAQLSTLLRAMGNETIGAANLDEGAPLVTPQSLLAAKSAARKKKKGKPLSIKALLKRQQAATQAWLSLSSTDTSVKSFKISTIPCKVSCSSTLARSSNPAAR